MNPVKMQLAEDLSQLNYLNESSILNVIRSRYTSNLIHTYAGPTMLVINPGSPLNLYTDKVNIGILYKIKYIIIDYTFLIMI